jgi:hypothetical protein
MNDTRPADAAERLAAPSIGTPAMAADEGGDAIIYMIAGPHSGYSLDEIFEMKVKEQAELGLCYWGYGGSLCHPRRVVPFAEKVIRTLGASPRIVFGRTATKYVSKSIGRITKFSVDGQVMQPLPSAVTMIGCSIAVVCRNLTPVAATIDLNAYRVANGMRRGRPLGSYIRYQVNKACALRANNTVRSRPRLVEIVGIADLAAPYCVYLAP